MSPANVEATTKNLSDIRMYPVTSSYMNYIRV